VAHEKSGERKNLSTAASVTTPELGVCLRPTHPAPKVSQGQSVNADSEEKKECSERVPSKNALADREHRDSSEHSSSQIRQRKRRRTREFCVSRFSRNFREHTPAPGMRLRPLRTLSNHQIRLLGRQTWQQVPVIFHREDQTAGQFFAGHSRRTRYVIGIFRDSTNAGTINKATEIASAGVPVANRTSVASSMIRDSSMVLMAV
jgi:hypothetical protein